MDNPVPETITLDALSSVRCWVAWQTEDREPGKPPTKVPYAPERLGDRLARANAPGTWGTRQQARDRADRLPKPYGIGGIGIEFTVLDDGRALAGVDLDVCLNAEGALEPWAADVMERLETYCEISPSGTGIKAFFSYEAILIDQLRPAHGHVEVGQAVEARRWRASASDRTASWQSLLRSHRAPLGRHADRVSDGAVGRAFRGCSQKQGLPSPGLGVSLLENEHGRLPPPALTDSSREAIDLVERINRKASLSPTLAKRWSGDWTGLNDQSRSCRSFVLGATLKRAGFTFEEMVAALEMQSGHRGMGPRKGRYQRQS